MSSPNAAYIEGRVPLCLTLTRAEQFTLFLRARELREMTSDPTLEPPAMLALRRDFFRAVKTLAEHGFNFWRAHEPAVPDLQKHPIADVGAASAKR